MRVLLQPRKPAGREARPADVGSGQGIDHPIIGPDRDRLAGRDEEAEVEEHVRRNVDLFPTGRGATRRLRVDLCAAAVSVADLRGDPGRAAELADDEGGFDPRASVAERVDVAGVVAAGNDGAHPHGHAGRVADELIHDPPGDGDGGIEDSAVAFLATGRPDSARHEAARPGGLHVNGYRVADSVVDPEPHGVLGQIGPGRLQRSLHLGRLAVEFGGVLVDEGNADGSGPRLGQPGRALRSSGRGEQAQGKPGAEEKGRERTFGAEHLVVTLLCAGRMSGNTGHYSLKRRVRK